MKREFNITGSCNPALHYMVDNSSRFAAVVEMIDRGRYFTINRARQFGKTTTLMMIWRRMSERYLVIPLSFEGVGEDAFASEAGFVGVFTRQVAGVLQHAGVDSRLVEIWTKGAAASMEDLSGIITSFTQASARPVVLTIDEVDKSSDNQLFLSFLGLLRNKYLARDIAGLGSTFHSVILAGVYDVKNLKLKLRPDDEQKYNSPWNIAADFTVDMTFHPEEIAQMLGDYEADHHTGMDISAVSEEIYRYTNGYPFLVSYICKLIDEQFGKNWSAEGILSAVKYIVKGGSTLLDDLSKNLENYPDFREFMYQVCINSESYAFSLLNPMVSMGNMFSYIKDNNGRVAIHNLVFEEALFLYFTLDYSIRNAARLSPFQLDYVENGHLRLDYAITRFADLMREEYRKGDESFLERHGRLVFLSFLKPIINGSGFYYVEPQTRDNKRMDLIVTYGREEFIVELKIWRGEAYEKSGLEQLSEYLSIRGREEGYLVTFDFSKNRMPRKSEWHQSGGRRIFEAVV